MTSPKQTLLAVIIKHLIRVKSMFQSFLTFLVSPSSGSLDSGDTSPGNSKTQFTATVSQDGKVAGTPALSTPLPPDTVARRTTVDFLREAEDLILGPVAGDGLLQLSNGLKSQFRERLQTDLECMLPSYSHKLPSGEETGRYLALDVGGSTLRVALVELRGQDEEYRDRESEVVQMQSFFIGKEVKDLVGVAFFDWMAERIVETLEKDESGLRERLEGALPMSLSWSFPIEQTSLRSGRIHEMGKAFRAADGLNGQDLGAVIEAACARAGLAAELRVISNDGNATLISRAYTHQSTRFGLILGTGVNIAAYLPVPLVAAKKFGEGRPKEWFDEARSVIVNTELGMFGKGVLSVTRWDVLLKDGHPRPDFQPLEHMVSGMYLGEVTRFVLLDAIKSTGVFGGVIPESLNEPYALSTETMSIVEGDSSITLETAIKTFSERHPSSHHPTSSDLAFLQALSAIISRRSAAIVAASLHAIWQLRLEGIREGMDNTSLSELHSSLDESDRLKRRAEAQAEMDMQRTIIAYNGSVIESYPRYKEACQAFINKLVADGQRESHVTDDGVRMDLVPSKESSILGAGVALAAALHDS